MEALHIFLSQNLLSVVLLLAGIALTGVEIFLPGFGLPGITGILCLVLGIYFGADTPVAALVMMIIIILILCAMLWGAMRSAARGRLSRSPLILGEILGDKAGFRSTENYAFLIGKEGTALSMLRPAGTVQIENRRYDVVTEAEFVQSGEWVRVLSVEGRRIVVRPVKATA